MEKQMKTVLDEKRWQFLTGRKTMFERGSEDSLICHGGLPECRVGKKGGGGKVNRNYRTFTTLRRYFFLVSFSFSLPFFVLSIAALRSSTSLLSVPIMSLRFNGPQNWFHL